MAKKDYCNGITRAGERCRAHELKGFGYCGNHLPDEFLEEAEKTGYFRCKVICSNPGLESYGDRCRNEAVNDSGKCAHHQPEQRWLIPGTRWQRRLVTKLYSVAEAQGVETPVRNPLEAILQLAEEAWLFKEECARRVVALEEGEWTYEHIAGEQIKGDIVLYERAMDRVMRTLLSVSKLGIEERLARVTERQALLIEKAIVHALEESGADLKVQDKARELVARQLRAVS